MAEAMCGPSNPLQQFKQHSQLDHTLQQDRLASRQRPDQVFRSHNPLAGALDPEFEAFQAGVQLPVQHHQAAHFPNPQSLAASVESPSWAADFQHMHISPPQAQQHFQNHPASVNWASGFREHLVENAPRAQHSPQSPQAFQQRARHGLSGFQSHFAQPGYAAPVVHTNTAQSKGKAPVTEQFDEAAFAAAFDQAREDMMTDEIGEQQEEESSAQELIDEVELANAEAIAEEAATQMLEEAGHEADLEDFSPLAKAHFGGDIEYNPVPTLQQPEEQKEEQRPYHDDDALAATAEELLEKVKHNQSDKFRNSQFLGLMRKLRDREVRVDGDKMVETVSPLPDLEPARTSHLHTHLSAACKVPGCKYDDHAWDSWDSPYR